VVIIDFSTFVNFLVAIGIGALIGMQREVELQKTKKKDFAGLRTFIFMTLLGAVSGFLASNLFESKTVILVIFGCLAVLIVAAYIATVMHFKEEEIGITTEVTALMSFLLGLMAMSGYTTFALITTIVIVGFLTLKRPLHEFAGKISSDEIYATLKFAVITILILPFLPNVNYTPMDIPLISKIIESAPFLSIEIASQLDVFNPFKIWLMVVFISGISFVGYILIRALGAGKGLGLTGFLGGLVSSTAVTSSMALESKKNSKIVSPFVLAVVVACSTMFIRVMVEVLVVNSAMLKYTAIPMTAMGLAGFISAFIIWRTIRKTHVKKIEFDSPFTLIPALKFAVFFAFVLFIAKFGYIMFGAKGIYIAALLSGLADVDAITLSLATLAGTGDISMLVATMAITLAAITNTIVKGGIAYLFGGKEFKTQIMTVFGIILGLGLLSAILLFI
jgi:uncharacterized membrane protein (DUF4010 family)